MNDYKICEYYQWRYTEDRTQTEDIPDDNFVAL